MWLSNPIDLTSGCLASSLTTAPLVSARPRKPLDTVASYHGGADTKQRLAEVCTEVYTRAWLVVLKLDVN